MFLIPYLHRKITVDGIAENFIFSNKREISWLHNTNVTDKLTTRIMVNQYSIICNDYRYLALQFCRTVKSWSSCFLYFLSYKFGANEMLDLLPPPKLINCNSSVSAAWLGLQIEDSITKSSISKTYGEY